MEDLSQLSDDDFKKMMFQEVESSIKQETDSSSVEFDNVMRDDYEPYKVNGETHLGKTLTILQETMPDFYDYIFIVHGGDTSELPNTADASWFDKKRVLLWDSAEHKYIPEKQLIGKYHHIFANYYWDTDNITSIPLGCYSPPNQQIIPMEERLHNMSFIGCLNRNRLQLASMLSKIPYLAIILASYAKEYRMLGLINHMIKWLHPRDYFKFTPDFGKGFDQTTYNNLLHSSKISLCPRGWSNVECFRIYESMRAGCVVITEKLPNRSYYKDIPAIQVNNWKEGLQIAADLLKDRSVLLTRLGEASRHFYETKLSPEATAKIIISKLAEKAI